MRGHLLLQGPRAPQSPEACTVASLEHFARGVLPALPGGACEIDGARIVCRF